MVDSFTYTPRNLVKDLIAVPAVVNLTYAYDFAANVTSIIDRHNRARDMSFTYDNRDRLTGFIGPWGTGAFEYNFLGNRVSDMLDGPTEGYGSSYVYENNRLVTYWGPHSMSFTYNYAGDLYNKVVDGQTFYYRYDDMRNLIRIFSVAEGKNLALYRYDADGERVLKNVNGVVTVYHYNKEESLLSESEMDGTPICDYVYLGGKLVAKINAGGTVLDYHTDPAGTPLAMTDASGARVWRAWYKPFRNEYPTIGSAAKEQRFATSKRYLCLEGGSEKVSGQSFGSG